MNKLASIALEAAPPTRKQWIVELLVATVVYLVVASLITWPLVANMSSGFYGFGNDNFGGVWNTGYLHDAFWGPGSLAHSDEIGYPWGASLPLEAIQPIDWFFIITFGGIADGLLAYNLQTFVGYIASGLAGYFAVRWFGASRYASLVLGTLFAIAPIHLALSQQYQALSNLAFLPLAAVAFVAVTRVPTFRRGVLLGLAAGLVWWGSYYYGWFGLFVLGAAVGLTILHSLVHRDWELVRARFRAVGGAVLGGVALIGLPAVLILRRIADDPIQDQRELTDLNFNIAPPWSVVLPPHDNPLLGTLTRDWLRSHGGFLPLYEQANYVGIALGVLAVLGVIALWKRERVVAIGLVGGLAAALILMVGTTIPHEFWKTSAWLAGTGAPHVKAPAGYLFDITPTFRYYGRAWAWGIAIVVLLAAAAIIRIERSRRLRPAVLLALLTGVGIFGAAEFVNRPPSHWIGTEVERAPWVQAVRALPADAVIVDYPAAGYSTPRSLYYQFWTSFHDRRTVNPFMLKRGGELNNKIIDPDSAASGKELSRLGVTYAIVHTDLPDPTFPPYQPAWPNDALPASAGASNPWLQRLHTGPDHVMYRVLKQPRKNVPAAASWEATSFLPGEMEGTREARWMPGTAANLTATSVPAARELVVPVRSASGRQRVTICTRQGRKVCVRGEVNAREYRSFRLPLVPSTYQTVSVETDGTPLRLGDISSTNDERTATLRIAQPRVRTAR